MEFTTLHGEMTMVAMTALFLARPVHQDGAEISIIDKSNLPLGQDFADARVAQSPQFSFALGGVDRSKIRIDIAWMTAQFSETLLDLRLQHSREALHADLLQVCRPIPLAVELGKITGRRMFPQRQSVSPRQIKEAR